MASLPTCPSPFLSLHSSVIAGATIHTSYVPSNNRTSESVLLTCCYCCSCRSFHTCLRSLCLREPRIILTEHVQRSSSVLAITISMQSYISPSSFNLFLFFASFVWIFSRTLARSFVRSFLIIDARGPMTMLVNWCSALARLCCVSHSLTRLLLNQIPGLSLAVLDGETRETENEMYLPILYFFFFFLSPMLSFVLIALSIYTYIYIFVYIHTCILICLCVPFSLCTKENEK